MTYKHEKAVRIQLGKTVMSCWQNSETPESLEIYCLLFRSTTGNFGPGHAESSVTLQLLMKEKMKMTQAQVRMMYPCTSSCKR